MFITGKIKLNLHQEINTLELSHYRYFQFAILLTDFKIIFEHR